MNIELLKRVYSRVGGIVIGSVAEMLHCRRTPFKPLDLDVVVVDGGSATGLRRVGEVRHGRFKAVYYTGVIDGVKVDAVASREIAQYLAGRSVNIDGFNVASYEDTVAMLMDKVGSLLDSRDADDRAIGVVALARLLYMCCFCGMPSWPLVLKHHDYMGTMHAVETLVGRRLAYETITAVHIVERVTGEPIDAINVCVDRVFESIKTWYARWRCGG